VPPTSSSRGPKASRTDTSSGPPTSVNCCTVASIAYAVCSRADSPTASLAAGVWSGVPLGVTRWEEGVWSGVLPALAGLSLRRVGQRTRRPEASAGKARPETMPRERRSGPVEAKAKPP
jgi:hypothetical protein